MIVDSDDDFWKLCVYEMIIWQSLSKCKFNTQNTWKLEFSNTFVSVTWPQKVIVVHGGVTHGQMRAREVRDKIPLGF